MTLRRARRAFRGKLAATLHGSAMATLPGLPQNDEPEPDALPVEPDDGTRLPGPPPETPPGHEPIDPPKA
jgi:hypothetical protein